MELKQFATLNNRSYSAQVNGLIKSGPQQIEQFKTLCANAALRTFETNDVTHINRMVEAALACGRFRTFSRVMPGVIPFAWNQSERVFHGKRQKGKYSKLSAIDDNGSAVFENLLVKYFDQDGVFTKTASKTTWDLDKAVLTLVKRAAKEGKSFKAVESAIEKAERQVMSA